jgi:SAM-dependent methyltransferase
MLTRGWFCKRLQNTICHAEKNLLEEGSILKSTQQNVNYGSWVSWRITFIPTVLALVCFVFCLLSLYMIIPGVFLLLITCYFLYARFLFSPNGRNIQEQIHGLVLEHLHWDGQRTLLDIGCGSAALTISLAKKYPTCTVVGTDLWGKKWEYSQKTCEHNAEMEGVGQRIKFQKASASSLPFEDGHFDAIVSNLVFHEVRDARDKLIPLREAFRVLRQGGKFALQDLFLEKRIFGEPDDLCKTISSWGIGKITLIKTRDSAFIPWLLKPPFMVGTLALLTGEK